MCPSSALLAFDTTKPDSMSRQPPDASRPRDRIRDIVTRLVQR